MCLLEIVISRVFGLHGPHFTRGLVGALTRRLASLKIVRPGVRVTQRDCKQPFQLVQTEICLAVTKNCLLNFTNQHTNSQFLTTNNVLQLGGENI